MTKTTGGDFGEFMVRANKVIRKSGVPNFMGEKILIPSQFNFGYLQEMLEDYHDRQVVELLKYGFPLSHDGKTGSKSLLKNHKGARDWPQQMESILNKEVATHSAIGPFDSSPFGDDTYLSPLNSVPKKDSDKRRLILDMSFPQGKLYKRWDSQG